MYDVAEVFVNGESTGVLWKEPYRLDITGLLKQGKNELQIEVVNQWVNRLTGDMNLNPEESYCRTNQPYIMSSMEENSDEIFRIQSSGLIGPAKVIFLKKNLRGLGHFPLGAVFCVFDGDAQLFEAVAYAVGCGKILVLPGLHAQLQHGLYKLSGKRGVLSGSLRLS